MRNWGIIITIFYGVVLVFLLIPMSIYLFDISSLEESYPYLEYLNDLSRRLDIFATVWIAILISGQILLLFLSVDTTWRRNKPRQHVFVTTLHAGVLTGLMVFFFIWSLIAAFLGEELFDLAFSPFESTQKGPFPVFGWFISWWLGLWILWAATFYWYYRNSDSIVSKAVSWLLAGSVLELLVAVPAHIIVRHREDCSAPIVTSWGIVTGIAVMLLSFGPGVLALYKKRINGYTVNRR